MTVALYGISNCDQVKKARRWLDAGPHAYAFHDFKKDGVDRHLIATWLTRLPWDLLVNRNGTTWRALSDERKAAIVDAASATDLMLTLPSVIKRPVLVTRAETVVGFSDTLYQSLFKKIA